MRGGKVLGICNGFQCLGEAVCCPVCLLPNVISSSFVKMFFIKNGSHKPLKFYCSWRWQVLSEEHILDGLEANNQLFLNIVMSMECEYQLQSKQRYKKYCRHL